MNNELEHHGILGMHWGIRRYQNYDGTLTKEGKKKLRAQSAEASSDSSSSTSSSTSSTKTSSELTPEELAARSERRKEIAKKVAIGVGVAAAVAGAAYLGTRAGMKIGEMNAQNPEAAKDLVSSMSNASVASVSSQPTVGSNNRVSSPTAEDVKNFTLKQETPDASKAPIAKQETPQNKQEVNVAPKVEEDKTSSDYKKAHSDTPISELSNQELASVISRLSMESKYSSLTKPKTVSGSKKVANILKGAGGAISAMTPVLSIMGGQSGATTTVANVARSVGVVATAIGTAMDFAQKIKNG